ncbi:hypothetical protein MNBD_NITROSPIRAE03-1063, partial [hydrothermal vent metagenome]
MGKVKKTLIMGIILLIAGTGVTAWYLLTPHEAVQEVDVKFVPDGAWLFFSSQLRLKSVGIQGPDGVIVSQFLNNIKKESLRLAFDWKKNTTYKFRLASSRGTMEIEEKSPDNDYAAAVQFSAPFTSMAESADPMVFEDKMEGSSTAVENNELTSAVIITTYQQAETIITGSVTIPAGVKVTAFPQNPDTKVVYREEETVIYFRTTLSVAYERFYLPFSIQVPGEGQYRLHAGITLKGAGDRESFFSRDVTVRVVNQESAGEAIRLVSTSIPVGIRGIALMRYAEDTLYIQPAVFQKLGRFFGVEPKYIDYNHPFTYQSLVLENTGTGSIALLVNSGIYYKDRDVTPEAFRPPDLL